MRKSKADTEEDFGDLHYLGGDDHEQFEAGLGMERLGGTAQRQRPARQRLELRDEQRNLRQQLSDWDDYSEGFENSL